MSDRQFAAAPRRVSPRQTASVCYVAAWLLAAAFASAAANSATGATPPGATPPVYPQVSRGSTRDVYHGVSVADPYRWLEQSESGATRRFVAAQNALAQPWLEALPQRAAIAARLKQLWSYERVGVPRKAGGRYFYLRNDGTQNQSVLHVSEQLAGPSRVLFDPNAQRADATLALARFEPSPDGSVLAYSISDGGTDWEIWRFRRVSDGTELGDELRFTKFWELSWARDGSGVYYSRYPQRIAPHGASRTPAQGVDARGDDQAQPVVYFHRLGERQSQDRRVYAVTDHPTRAPSAQVTDDGRYLVITLFDGYRANGIDLLDLSRDDAQRTPLFAAWDALYTVIGSEGDTFYVRTTHAAPRGRVIAVNARQRDPAQWREVVPEAADTLAEASWVGGRIVVQYVKDARGAARVFERDGRLVADVPMPGLGSVAGFPHNAQDGETFFSYTDFLSPQQVLRYDAAANTVSVFRAPRLDASVAGYVTRQVFYPSKDGTRIPLFITQRRDLVPDGTTPTLLYGYGGFDVSLTPAFSPAILVWLEMGGLYAHAILRGGGEYGAAWHEAGTKALKQNVFDDFLAGAEYLIRERYTVPQRLAISGRSNGGLLVAAALVQRPDLFGAALPAVGVLDMLRYQTASANARQWSSDYGLAENRAEFTALRAYSPVHNVRTGVCYPPTLVTTADRDDRVVPWHSYKFAAALQTAQRCANPVLLRVETRAGHGAGKPVWMQIEDYADQWAFAAAALGMRGPGPGPAIAGTP